MMAKVVSNIRHEFRSVGKRTAPASPAVTPGDGQIVNPRLRSSQCKGTSTITAANAITDIIAPKYGLVGYGMVDNHLLSI